MEEFMERQKILIVEDDADISALLVKIMEGAGYQVRQAFSGTEALFCMERELPDCVLLDLMLPGMTGEEVLEQIRQEQKKEMPVLILSAKVSVQDKVKLLRLGADDYITKPFSVMVLCKKVAAVFANMELRTPKHDVFEDEVLKIDFSEQSAVFEGKVIDFTPKEYRTLFLFVKNPHIILTKRQLIEKLWDIDGDFVDEHTLTTIISRIRKKIETDERQYIKTAYGMGYQWIGGESR